VEEELADEVVGVLVAPLTGVSARPLACQPIAVASCSLATSRQQTLAMNGPVVYVNVGIGLIFLARVVVFAKHFTFILEKKKNGR
jgi:hypothetical protein